MVEAIRVLREEIDSLEAEIANVCNEWEFLRDSVRNSDLASVTDRFIELRLKQETLANRLIIAQNRLEELHATYE